MENRTVIVYGGELYHHGTKGMKWHVWNDETRARYLGGAKRGVKEIGKSLRDGAKEGANDAVKSIAKSGVKKQVLDTKKKNQKQIDSGKKVIAGIAMMSVAAAAIYVSKNPAIAKKTSEVIKKIGPVVAKSLKEGANEGLKEGPKALSKAVVKGSFMVVGKKIVDKALGNDRSDAIFKANDKDKIGKFWTKSSEKEEVKDGK